MSSISKNEDKCSVHIPVPSSAAELTKEWFQNVISNNLNTCKETSKVTITEFEVKKAVASGDNYMSVVSAVDITARIGHDEKNFHFMVKTLPENELLRDIAKKFKVFQQEIHIYKDVLPRLSTFAGSYNVDGAFSIPKCIYLDVDSDEQGCVVMENMGTNGYNMANRLEGLDIEQGLAVLRAVAKVHGISFAAIKKIHIEKDYQLDDFFSEACKAEREHYKAPEMQNFVEDGSKSYEIINGVIKDLPFYNEVECKIKRITQNFRKLFVILAETNGPIKCLVHGDLWCNNVLLKKEKDNQFHCGLLDWQISHFAHPFVDLAYFFYTSFAGDVRMQNLERLFQEYLAHFVSTVEKFGIHLENEYGYSRDMLEKDFKYQYRVLGLLFAGLQVPGIVSQKSKDMDLKNYNEDQLREAFTTEAMSNVLVRQRYESIVTELHEDGVLDWAMEYLDELGLP